LINILLIREKSVNGSTPGQLFIDDVFFCYTLEDEIRDKKIPNETAISTGTFEIIINYSNRFKRAMPLLLNVPNFTGIRMHSGVTKEHTSGCILLGLGIKDNYLRNTKKAFLSFFTWLQEAVKKDHVFLTIVNEL